MMKLGGTITCPYETGPVSYVFLKMPVADFNVCSVGIFTCTCDNSSQSRNELISHTKTVELTGQATDTFTMVWPAMDN